VVPPPIIRCANNCIYSICYLLLWKQVAVTVWQTPVSLDTVVCAPNDRWRYHPKHVEQFPDINKLRKVASCWIYTGIYVFLFQLLYQFTDSREIGHDFVVRGYTKTINFNSLKSVILTWWMCETVRWGRLYPAMIHGNIRKLWKDILMKWRWFQKRVCGGVFQTNSNGN
jgi:hypothetical protein